MHVPRIWRRKVSGNRLRRELRHRREDSSIAVERLRSLPVPIRKTVMDALYP